MGAAVSFLLGQEGPNPNRSLKVKRAWIQELENPRKRMKFEESGDADGEDSIDKTCEDGEVSLEKTGEDSIDKTTEDGEVSLEKTGEENEFEETDDDEETGEENLLETTVESDENSLTDEGISDDDQTVYDADESNISSLIQVRATKVQAPSGEYEVSGDQLQIEDAGNGDFENSNSSTESLQLFFSN